MSLTEHGKINGILYIITRIINKAEIIAIPVKQFMYKNKSALLLIFFQLRPNKKISVSENFRKGRYTTVFFFLEKNNFMHFERHFALQNA